MTNDIIIHKDALNNYPYDMVSLNEKSGVLEIVLEDRGGNYSKIICHNVIAYQRLLDRDGISIFNDISDLKEDFVSMYEFRNSNFIKHLRTENIVLHDSDLMSLILLAEDHVIEVVFQDNIEDNIEIILM